MELQMIFNETGNKKEVTVIITFFQIIHDGKVLLLSSLQK